MYFPGLHSAFKELLLQCRGQKVAVVGHRRPDGDCIGAQVALVRVLQALNIEAFAVNESIIPKRVNFIAEGVPFYHGAPWVFSGEKVILVDCSDVSRVGPEMEKNLPEILGNIDHHRSNEGFATFDLVKAQSSATCEILAGLFIDCDFPVDELTAQALWAGIVTDTGNFTYPSTTGQVLQLAAYLVRMGASPSKIAQLIYERESLSRMKLLQRILDRMEVVAGGLLCYTWVEEDDFAETGATYEETEGFVNYGRSLDGVEVAAYFEIREGEVKGSLRSGDETFRMDMLAGNFGGGGHACAAGFTWKGSFSEFLPQFQEAAEKLLAETKGEGQEEEF
ncbi:MAG: bifunctional oligoribonuclease/PAP phosphatase NrnA [Opitutales bacterium]|nr:bifunctional oligoribonuclease/PAP phosphatase NrnA [Opitutales bacterium]MCH8539227.1 bifunctional oligoribonuclease/PAP phosphatase NrnA [Opitutales bacterium]